jgi:hypothetical protein
MALWLSLVLATLSYAAPPRAQGGASRTDTLFHQFIDVLSLTFVHPTRTNQVMELLMSRLQENGFKVADFAPPAISDIARNL